jgi:hypothetical protein
MDIGQGITFGGGVSISMPPVIGQAMGGGFYAGEISTAGNGVADYYLVVGPRASCQATRNYRYAANGGPGGATSAIDGPSNTANLVTGGSSYYAGNFCADLTVGGYTDWYMPARNELEVCYYNLKASASNNWTAETNPNSVPSRASTPYTGSVPGQTSVASFQSGGSEAFGGNYWSSTGDGGAGAWRIYWGGPVFNGRQTTTYMTANEPVRAVRRLPV